MKKLQKEFTANYDKVGNNKFIQIKKENGVAIYERQNMDGSHRSYEVFAVKVVEKGTPLPGGNKVQETYEQNLGSIQRKISGSILFLFVVSCTSLFFI